MKLQAGTTTERKTVTVSFKVTASNLGKLDAVCRALNITRTDVITQLLELLDETGSIKVTEPNAE